MPGKPRRHQQVTCTKSAETGARLRRWVVVALTTEPFQRFTAVCKLLKRLSRHTHLTTLLK